MLRISKFFTKPVEDFFVENAQGILKPKIFSQPHDEHLLKKKNIKQVNVFSGERLLYAHGIIHESKNSAPPKAIVYMPGNVPFFNDSLEAADLLAESLVTHL